MTEALEQTVRESFGNHVERSGDCWRCRYCKITLTCMEQPAIAQHLTGRPFSLYHDDPECWTHSAAKEIEHHMRWCKTKRDLDKLKMVLAGTLHPIA